MIWLRLFWAEAILVPAYFLWRLAQTPDGARFKTLNLVLWGLAEAVAIAGFVYTTWKRSGGSKGADPVSQEETR